jgi:hypothetical protein
MVIASLVTITALAVQYAWDGRHVARLLADPPTDLFGAIRADDEAIALHCVRAGGGAPSSPWT